MIDRKRPSWLALGGAAILTLVLSSVVLGADPLALAGPTPESETDPLVSATIGTWEDTDGNGIDDDCQETVEADPVAAAAADVAVDADGDGTVSVTEAAHSDRVGGTNCNHGGYVSIVAQAEDAEEDAEEAEEAAEEAADEACVPVAAPTFDPVALVEPGGFGAYVSTVAQSGAVGGKNCNHGGAVSEAAKAAKEVVKAERAAAKAERAAERAAAKAEAAAARATVKAERAADRAAAKAERNAARAERATAKAERQAGKAKGGG